MREEAQERKKGLKAMNRKTKSVKPIITWVDLEDEVDDLLDMELEDESQKTESAGRHKSL